MRDIPNLSYTSTNPFAKSPRDSGNKPINKKITKGKLQVISKK